VHAEGISALSPKDGVIGRQLVDSCETLTAARDVAEAIDVEYEPLLAITEAKEATTNATG